MANSRKNKVNTRYSTVRTREVTIRLNNKTSLAREPKYYFGLIDKFLENLGFDHRSRYFNTGSGGVWSCTIIVPFEDAFSLDLIARWAMKRSWVKNIRTFTTLKEIYTSTITLN